MLFWQCTTQRLFRFSLVAFVVCAIMWDGQCSVQQLDSVVWILMRGVHALERVYTRLAMRLIIRHAGRHGHLITCVTADPLALCGL